MVTAREGDPGDRISYVIPGLLGAAAATLLILVVAVVLAFTQDRSTCARVACWVVVVPVVAVLPLLALVLIGSAGVLVPAVLPVVITAVAAGAVWRSARAGVFVLGLFLVGGVTTVAVLDLDAVFLLLPHLLIGSGAGPWLSACSGAWSSARTARGPCSVWSNAAPGQHVVVAPELAARGPVCQSGCWSIRRSRACCASCSRGFRLR